MLNKKGLRRARLERARRRGMADGFILLGFIALAIAVVTARVRRRMGFPVRQGFYASAIAITAIAVLLLWVTQNH
jgi:predicted nucleic acid-binding protein